MATRFSVGRTITAPAPRVVRSETVPDQIVYDEEAVDGELDMNGAVWGMLPSGRFRFRSGQTIAHLVGRREHGQPIVNPTTGFMVPHHDTLLNLLDPDEFEDITDRTQPPRITPTRTIDVIEANNMSVDTTLCPRMYPLSGATDSGGAKVVVVESVIDDNVPGIDVYNPFSPLPIPVFPTMGVLEILEVRALSGMEGITLGMVQESFTPGGPPLQPGAVSTVVPLISCALTDFAANTKVAALTYTWGLDWSSDLDLIKRPSYNKYNGELLNSTPFRRVIACYGQGYPGQTNGRFDITIRWTELPLASHWDPTERGAALTTGTVIDPSDIL